MTWRIIRGVPGRVSGEHARLRPDGTITLPGRGHHCINTAGEKVCPDGDEEVLKPFPRIIVALVFGETGARPGQRVAAIVSQKKVTGLDALASFARQNRQTRKTLAGPAQAARRRARIPAAKRHPEYPTGVSRAGRLFMALPARPAGIRGAGRPAG
jgi:acyl-coenzyme A synthetase/AMP-(fatty) acid ligase